MPCDSRIYTQISDGTQLETALRELGYTVSNINNGGRITGTRGAESIIFISNGGNYSASAAAGRRTVETIARKYAEVGIRAFAKAKGYHVQYDEAESRLVLTSRRY